MSKFFDVHSGTTMRPSSSTLDSNEVQVPWGKGIIGYVAEHGETVNIPNAYEVLFATKANVIMIYILLHYSLSRAVGVNTSQNSKV